MNILVLAKEPVPGRVKTRLCPPCAPDEAAAVAAAALFDTFAAALGAGADRVIAVLDGQPGDWLPAGVEVRPQASGSFSVRLTAAWASAEGPTLQVGMDTPQVTAAELASACTATADAGTAFGPAADGGWWALGLRRPRSDLFRGVEPSTRTTGRHQLARLVALGLRPHLLPVRRDVDTWDDAVEVAAAAPGTRFAAAVDAVRSGCPL